MVEPVTVIALSSTLIGWGSPWIGSVNALEHSASMHVVTDWIGPSKSPGSGSTRKSLNSEWISLNFISVSQTVLRSTSSVIIGWPLIGSVGRVVQAVPLVDHVLVAQVLLDGHLVDLLGVEAQLLEAHWTVPISSLRRSNSARASASVLA